MKLGDVLLKVSRQQKISLTEERFIQDMFRETQNKNSFVGNNISNDGNLKFSSPIEMIYSNKIEKPTDVLASVDIPSKYNHLIIFLTGDSETGSIVGLLQPLVASLCTYFFYNIPSLGIGVVQHAAFLSQLGDSAQLVFLHNIQSNFYKGCNVLCFAKYPGFGDYVRSFQFIGNLWTNTDKINKIIYTNQDGTYSAGYILTIYGIV